MIMFSLVAREKNNIYTIKLFDLQKIRGGMCHVFEQRAIDMVI